MKRKIIISATIASMMIVIMVISVVIHKNDRNSVLEKESTINNENIPIWNENTPDSKYVTNAKGEIIKDIRDVDEFSEWICKDGNLEMKWVFLHGRGYINANINGNKSLWFLDYIPMEDEKLFVNLAINNETEEDDYGIGGIGTFKDGKIIMKITETSEEIGNRSELTFHRISNSIPKLAVQACLNTNKNQFFGEFASLLSFVKYEQVSGNEREGKVRVTSGVSGDEKIKFDFTFNVEEKNGVSNVYYDDKRVYAYVLDAPIDEVFSEAVLAYLSEEKKMNVTYAVISSSFDEKKQMEKIHVSNSYYANYNSDDDLDNLINYEEDFYVEIDSKSNDYLVYDKEDNLIYRYYPIK